MVDGLQVVGCLTAGDHYPKMSQSWRLGLVVCLSVAGHLWTGIGQLVWILSMWIVEVDIDECFRLSFILINIMYIRSTYMCVI